MAYDIHIISGAYILLIINNYALIIAYIEHTDTCINVRYHLKFKKNSNMNHDLANTCIKIIWSTSFIVQLPLLAHQVNYHVNFCHDPPSKMTAITKKKLFLIANIS